MMFDKVLTITVNPALDATLWLSALDFDEPVKATRETVCAGGKALNVARVLTSLGIPARLTGLAGQQNILSLEKLLLKDKVDFDLIPVRGAVRENLTLVLPDGRVLKVNRMGSPPERRALSELKSKIRTVLREHTGVLVVFAGSLPPSMTKEDYKEIIRYTQKLGAPVAVDTPFFTQEDYQQIKPFAIKPNLTELKTVLGRSLRGDASVVKAARELSKDVEHVLISLGCKGLVYANREKTVRVCVPQVEVKSTVGAGDTTLAAFLAQLSRKGDPVAAARYAAAAGTASVTLDGTGVITRMMVEKILPEVLEQGNR